MQNDYLVCIIEDIFTPAERTLVAAGSAEHVRSTRTVFQDAVEPEFVELIERVTGRRVRAFMSQVDTDTDLAIEFFLFEPRPEDDPPTGASPDGNEP
jgi:uncharacterized protein YbcI